MGQWSINHVSSRQRGGGMTSRWTRHLIISALEIMSLSIFGYSARPGSHLSHTNSSVFTQFPNVWFGLTTLPCTAQLSVDYRTVTLSLETAFFNLRKNRTLCPPNYLQPAPPLHSCFSDWLNLQPSIHLTLLSLSCSSESFISSTESLPTFPLVPSPSPSRTYHPIPFCKHFSCCIIITECGGWRDGSALALPEGPRFHSQQPFSSSQLS